MLDAFDTVLKTQADQRDASERDAEAERLARASSRPLMAAAAVILLAVGGYLALARPDWVFAPRPTVESIALQEASLRIAMANASQHIERFRQRNGRLPETLAEAGGRDAGLGYSRVGPSGYRLVGDNGSAQVTFSSEQTLHEFLGNSYAIVARRAR